MSKNYIDGDRLQRIVIDVSRDITPNESTLDYSTEELAIREAIEREWKAERERDPKAVLDVRD